MRFPDIYKKENQIASFDNYLILCGQRWIRTTEGVSQQIYSLPHLATLVFAQHVWFKKSDSFEKLSDSEERKTGLKPATLSLEG